MLSNERVNYLRGTYGITSNGRGIKEWAHVAAFARAVEREATAEAVRIMREWVAAKDARFAATWADYERAAHRLDAAGQAIREYLKRME